MIVFLLTHGLDLQHKSQIMEDRMLVDGKMVVTLSLDRAANETLIKSNEDRAIIGQPWVAAMEESSKREKVLQEMEKSLQMRQVVSEKHTKDYWG